ncbi:MAG: HlyD family efflux transporter periplasmic adaptor subunit [Lactobacillales bacterium]|jgi:multidrug efflux pump subunit AcrA (membrane-fusion protein)|nr:HlyD family efflux transporter periplasmic adaptor subunit [Lactobacillales bacterium]
MAIFRQKSLDKLSSPEQLDKLVVVASPMTWLTLIGAGLIVVATVIWSIVSTVPKTETASGIYMNVGDLQSIHSMSQGIVRKALVKSGDKVKKGKVLFEVAGGNDIVATTSGTVYSIAVTNGTPVAKGTMVARIKEAKNQAYVTSYVGIQVAKTIKEGMAANVYVSAFPKEEYGHMEAKVDYVGDSVTSSADMVSVLGDESLARLFSAAGPVVEVRCKLETDSSSVSGYKWSTKQGEDVKPEGGTPVTADIVVAKKAPISMLIPNIKEKFGVE